MNKTVTTILMVDDDQDYLFQQKLELEAEGYNIVTADTRKKAKALLNEFKPDIAIIDLMMQEMDDGFVLSYEIKKKYPDVPVIMVTAVTGKTGMEFDSVTPEEKHWIKADTIFTKPVRTEQLLKEIKRLLKF
jgi:DNA-binding response OmpR family regulator